MTQPRLLADFQPLAAEGRGGMERVWHDGAATSLDITPLVLGMSLKSVRELHAEASQSSGKDLDFVADAIPGFVEANAGKGGFDVLLDGDDVEDFFALHGIRMDDLTEGDLASLREDYGVEAGAIPFVAGEGPESAPSPKR